MTAYSTTEARNLPTTTAQSLTGAVRSNSRVPVRDSSESRRMVSAGHTSSRKMVTTPNTLVMLACWLWLTARVKKNPVPTNQKATTTYATGETKYERSSLDMM